MKRGFALPLVILIVTTFVAGFLIYNYSYSFIEDTQTERLETESTSEANAELPTELVKENNLPDGIYNAQIKKTYVFDKYYALVLQPSVNVYLSELPKSSQISFTGVLARENENQEWQKVWEVKDTISDRSNNPYHMWQEGKNLILAVVNQNGAGSGEGYMTLVRLHDEEEPEFVSCYYFGGNYNSPLIDGDYYEFTEKLDQHEIREMEECDGLMVVRVKQ